MEITIRLDDGWRVESGGKYADHLTWDEMLGLVASLTVPEKRPCLHWMLTPEHHAERNRRFEVKTASREANS